MTIEGPPPTLPGSPPQRMGGDDRDYHNAGCVNVFALLGAVVVALVRRWRP